MSTATDTRPIRHLPRWQIAARIKARGLTQWDIAQAAGVSQGVVSRVIARRGEAAPATIERVWQAIEAKLGPQG